jgi:predicted alpha-1,6-mannanase (GH76 family)
MTPKWTPGERVWAIVYVAVLLDRQNNAAKRKHSVQEVNRLLRQMKTKKANRKLTDIESEAWHDADQAWFLTPAAQKYLVQGTVTIKTGFTKKAAADAD